uniref:Protein SPT2 homolog n=1 Tax=Parascaris univalens TaxID=6257 RepID=A0A914ZL98_PARUN
MDLFDEILKQASNNSQNASKEIKAIDKTTEQAKRIRNERDVLERKNAKEAAKRAAAPPPEKPKFSIPKLKHSKQEGDEMSGRIAAFMQKKKEEERKRTIEKQQQKEKLIQMRLQTTFGGKANKKLAKQFGTTPIELQQKYGNDREHEEHLKRLQYREEEEFDRQCTELRGSVMKALERKKAVDKLAPTAEERKAMGRHRVAINKQNSLRHFMKEDSPGPGPSSKNVVSAKKKPPPVQPMVKKRPVPSSSAIDFSLLMKKAEAIQRGESPPRSPSPPPPPKKKNPYYEPLNTDSVRDEPADRKHSSSARPSTDRSQGLSSHAPTSSGASSKPQYDRSGGGNKYGVGVVKTASNKSTTQSQKSYCADKESLSNEHSRTSQMRVKKTQSSVRSTSKAAVPSSSKNATHQSAAAASTHNVASAPGEAANKTCSQSIPSAPSAPTKRYLPGDIRYQGPPPTRNPGVSNGSASRGYTGSSCNGGGSYGYKRDKNELLSKEGKPDSKTVERVRNGDRRGEDDNGRPVPPYGHNARPIQRDGGSTASMRAKERMILEQRRRREMAHAQRRYQDEDDEEVDDEEYDSDLDDFIDDTELDDHLKRTDLEETLRMINPRYDRKRWRMNERMIDDRRMESNFREISREETRSSRIGLIEDIREAQRGNSFAL